jgi:AraC family transcriptional regulator
MDARDVDPAHRVSSGSRGELSFLYRVRQDFAAPPLFMGETVFAPGQSLPSHVHDRPLMFSLLEGCGSHTVGGETRMLAPAEVVFIPAQTPHSVAFGRGISRVFTIEFDHEAVIGVSKPLPDRPCHSSDIQLLSAVLRTYRHFASRESLCGTSLSRRLLTALSTVEGRPCDMPAPHAYDWLREAAERVRHSAGSSLRMYAIASQLGVHPVHLSRCFRRVYGESMSGFRERLRLELVSRALLRDSRTISSIAAELGFSDHAHLTRSFRRAAQMTPSEFRGVIGSTSLPQEVTSDLRSSRAFVFRQSIAAGIRVA